MKRHLLAGAATTVLLVTAIALAACGAADEAQVKAQKSLDGALQEYQSALDRVKLLDVRTAAKEEVAAARSELSAAWLNVRKWSKEAGSDAAGSLKSAYGELDKALGKAVNGAGTGLAEAEQAVEKAVDSVRSQLDKAWNKLKELF